MTWTRRHLLLVAASSAVAGTVPWRAQARPSAGESSGLPVTPLQLLAAPVFNDQVLFALGGASSQTAEVGEVLRIAQVIRARSGNPSDPPTAAFDALVEAFGSAGDRLEQLAEQASAHPVTSRHRWFRAATCAAQQLFFVFGSGDGAREEALFASAQRRWLQAIRLLEPRVERFVVASRFGELPVTFFPAPGGSGARPTVLISEGSDGQNVETMQFGVTAALARGYNVVLFEGPGQMSLLFQRQIPFTPDWDQVVGPVLDAVRQRSDVGRVALIGISFGGMLCARAAAALSGLDAVVFEPAAWSFTPLWGDQTSMAAVQRSQGAGSREQQQVCRQVNAGLQAAWPSLSPTERFQIHKRGEIFSRQVLLEARAGQPPSDYYGLLEAMLPFDFRSDWQRIRIPSLVLANQGDWAFADQSEQAFALLTALPPSQKRLVRLTAAEGASLHDQPVGAQVAEEIVFDWLDEQLR
ncbi:alpha/beta hydrolase [Synechococcus sp. CCY9202]|uniref:alpha/beta hydrolase family protein n=1 Tax=Synechococcus sp. CCY9202 TaxID=174698 RepID=UPI002B1ECBAF|nr:alpha/beta hydrolase [Synechococcus sp. CCY9202]MEA5421882.1 alpha/beta hydrolase [Synechococcus sp. CCY9202]